MSKSLSARGDGSGKWKRRDDFRATKRAIQSNFDALQQREDLSLNPPEDGPATLCTGCPQRLCRFWNLH